MTPKTGTEPRQETPAKLECHSMTGFAQARAEHAGWAIRISVKSVNHRFLDFKLRMPDALEPYDLRLRQAVQNRIHRGHVDIHLNVEPGEAAPVHVNRELLQAYLRAADELRQQTGAKAELDIVSLLRLPGVIGGLAPALPDADEEQEALGKALETCLAEALAKLDEMRRTEGRHLTEELRARVARIARAGGTGARAGEHAAAGVCAAAGIAAEGIAERRAGGFRATGAGSGAAGGTQRYQRGTRPLAQPPAAVCKTAGWGGRTREEAGFSFAGNAPGSEHDAFEDAGRGKRSADDHQPGAGNKGGHRKIAGTGPEHRMSEPKPMQPLVLIVSGPSGSGKSTLVQKILEMPGTMPSVSCTTRPRRATEASGKCYDFVTSEKFDAMVARGEFLEYARVFGKHSYGTPKNGSRSPG